MRAEVSKVNEIIIVELSGYTNLDSVEIFKNYCKNKFPNEKVIFDLSKLNFVGSTGLTAFFEVFRDIIESGIFRIEVCKANNDFLRLFEAWFGSALFVHVGLDQAIAAMNQSSQNKTSLQIRIPSKFDDISIHPKDSVSEIEELV